MWKSGHTVPLLRSTLSHRLEMEDPYLLADSCCVPFVCKSSPPIKHLWEEISKRLSLTLLQALSSPFRSEIFNEQDKKNQPCMELKTNKTSMLSTRSGRAGDALTAGEGLRVPQIFPRFFPKIADFLKEVLQEVLLHIDCTFVSLSGGFSRY